MTLKRVSAPSWCGVLTGGVWSQYWEGVTGCRLRLRHWSICHRQ